MSSRTAIVDEQRQLNRNISVVALWPLKVHLLSIIHSRNSSYLVLKVSHQSPDFLEANCRIHGP